MSKQWRDETTDEETSNVEIVQTPPGMHPARKEVVVGKYHFIFEEEDLLQIIHQAGVLTFTAREAYTLFTLLYDHREIVLHQLSQEQSNQGQETEQS